MSFAMRPARPEGTPCDPSSFRIAVIGSGISALSAAWLLSQRHHVTLYEAADRLGGHSNTVDVRTPQGDMAVDTGFIVFNDHTYPNLIALFEHLDVPTRATDMSFSMSRGNGHFEYAAPGLFAQKRNLVNPRFWYMLSEILRFYRVAPTDLARLDDPALSLRDYLKQRSFSRAFQDDHLLPMAAAIWSSPAGQLLDYPAAAFIRFCDNHGLLKLRNRPLWRTIVGGSRVYVEKIAQALAAQPARVNVPGCTTAPCAEPGNGTLRLGRRVIEVRRGSLGVSVRDSAETTETFDHVVIGTHADQALAMLADPSHEERRLLGAFAYSRNHAVLHMDTSLMPKRRRAWASWNYIEADGGLCVSYWMNRLQGLEGPNVFVTLNPPRPPAPGTLLRSEIYEHPIFDARAMASQQALWPQQGRGGVWFCGSYFGSGFHEDGAQAGFAVAEQLGGVRRPWQVAQQNGRIHLRVDSGRPVDAVS